jgi:hypothetical protein
MTMSKTRIVPVILPNGRSVQLEATVIDAEEEVGVGDLLFGDVLESLRDMAGCMQETLATLKPDKVSVEVGVEVGLESGKLTALFLKGTGSANLKVTLEWGAGTN